MTVARRLLRPSLIALAAILGASLSTGVSAEGSTAGGCTDSQAHSACCPTRPETCTSGCCPSRTLSLSTTGLDKADSSVGLPTPRPACIPSACQCRPSEPAAPAPNTDRRSAEGPSSLVDGIAPGWLGHHAAPASSAVVLSATTDRPNRPLHILTTHLRF